MGTVTPIDASPARRGRRSGHCIKCGIYREVLIRDRIIPGYLGGTYTVDNVQYICANCHQDKTALEQSAANRGRRQSAELRAKTAAGLRGRPKSSELKAKISATLKGRSLEPLSPERRAKISAALKGRSTGPRGPQTPEHRAAISRGKIEARRAKRGA